VITALLSTLADADDDADELEIVRRSNFGSYRRDDADNDDGADERETDFCSSIGLRLLPTSISKRALSIAALESR